VLLSRAAAATMTAEFILSRHDIEASLLLWSLQPHSWANSIHGPITENVILYTLSLTTDQYIEVDRWRSIMIVQWEDECISLHICALRGPGHDSSVGEWMYPTVCPFSGPGHDSSVGEWMYLTACPLYGPGHDNSVGELELSTRLVIISSSFKWGKTTPDAHY